MSVASVGFDSLSFDIARPFDEVMEAVSIDTLQEVSLKALRKIRGARHRRPSNWKADHRREGIVARVLKVLFAAF